MSPALALHVARTWSGEPIEADEQVTLHLYDDGDLMIAVEAPAHGDPAPEGPPGPRPALWEHEVVELFVLGPGERYTEIELGPHGHHLVLRLHGVRNAVESGLPLDFRAEVEGARWRGLARVPRDLLPPPPHRINAYAIHGQGAARRYLAMSPVPGDKPDFHRLGHFIDIQLP